MLVGIHHTAISTPDLARSKAFYRDLFGFEEAFEFTWDVSNEDFKRTHAMLETAGTVAMLERGTSRLEIFQYTAPAPAPNEPARRNVDHGLSHISIEVKDIDEEYARLGAAGMQFLSEPVPQAYIKCCYGTDPDGNVIELIEYFDHIVDGSA
jgi:catechol 2,3-dioxygenase-like lactoylglutathione lyase family enzyme